MKAVFIALLIALVVLLSGCATTGQPNRIVVGPGVEIIELKAVLTETGVLVWSDDKRQAIHFELKLYE